MKTYNRTKSPNYLCQNIRLLRNLRKLSQENVAFELNISQAAYANMENGKTNISIGRLIKIASIFNVNLETITSDSLSDKYKL